MKLNRCFIYIIAITYIFAINAQAAFHMPAVTIPGDYSYLDPDNLIPKNLLAQSVGYYDQLKNKINNKNYLVIIDYRQHNSKERFFVIDMISGQVDKYLAAHGKNSDPDFDGYATSFSNEPNSLMTSLGLFLTAETYTGSHGLSLVLDGLSSTNSNARARAIVIHGASYVTPGEKIGRSWGCPALELRYTEEVINKIKGGALIYASY
jgi:hypothetical protein